MHNSCLLVGGSFTVGSEDEPRPYHPAIGDILQPVCIWLPHAAVWDIGGPESLQLHLLGLGRFSLSSPDQEDVHRLVPFRLMWEE